MIILFEGLSTFTAKLFKQDDINGDGYNFTTEIRFEAPEKNDIAWFYSSTS